MDHQILLQRLQHRFGFNDTVLAWFNSYLCDRRQSVSAQGVEYSPLLVLFGVQKGSVMGAPVYTLYGSPAYDIATLNGILVMLKLCLHLP